MTRRHRSPLVALVLGLCLVAASCGQKAGVAGTDVAAGGVGGGGTAVAPGDAAAGDEPQAAAH